jgi:hypothetical protein
MDFGGTQKIIDEIDFRTPFNEFNENCCLSFLHDVFKKDLTVQLKPRYVYETKLHELCEVGTIDSMTKFNLMNVYRLHINEHDIL